MNFYDLSYRLGLYASAPYWLVKPSARNKVLVALRQRMGQVPKRESNASAIWIHAVSLGEINATRALIEELQRSRSDLTFIVSTTTKTGYERGEQLYGNSPNVQLIRYPLDFSSAIVRALDAIRPSVVVLMELEIWPNFVLQCQKRNIPVMIANGRITEPSFRKYMRIKPITRRMMRRISRVCVQDDTYARRFMEMGARRENVCVTGTMKFDTAQVADRVEGDAELAQLLGLHAEDEFTWVCGSTGPGEEEIILNEYRALLAKHGRMRLAIIPRHPERFDEVADLIRQHRFNVIRQSRVTEAAESRNVPPVILGDTMGQLRKFYSLADVVFVGRSLVDLGPRQHGSDMIEPAALAKPVIVGPYTGNFAEAMQKFRDARAIVEVNDGAALGSAVTSLLASPAEAREMGHRAQEVVERERGATQRHAQEVLALLDRTTASPSPTTREPEKQN
jgi:3-deoxy-D-manno-octulosonic-acid transferase